jgi:hypothetical protein
MLKVADGPDEVHKMVIARRELNHWAKEAEGASDGTGPAESVRDAATAKA